MNNSWLKKFKTKNVSKLPMNNYGTRIVTTIFFSFVLFFLTIPAKSQLLIGPRVGVQYTWVRYSDSDYRDSVSVSPVLNYFAGFTTAFRVKNRFFLEIDLLYSRMGKEVESKIDESLEYKMYTDHIQLPILYRVDFKKEIGKDKSFKWYVGAGPTLSYWLSGHGTVSSSELIERGIDKIDYKVKFNSDYNEAADDELGIPDPNRLQLGLNIGGGLVFEFPGVSSLAVDLRFEMGHSYLGKGDAAEFRDIVLFTDSMESKNMAIKIGVSYLMDTRISERKKGKSSIKRR
ncbi:porin family protein [Fulvivirga sediminis]|uniref:PorT family protein n=1 Tax=Fulvivirga sediminis TaxID=2803949 RepID=A0A937K054_9BACT|nr:porin family protein [Fulvivirga sediminis]MBL3657309.1 PorT family protein [Fulvivirga sediminis]